MIMKLSYLLDCWNANGRFRCVNCARSNDPPQGGRLQLPQFTVKMLK
jgi:hypothetical protein